MQVCTSLQTDNHASTAPLSFFTGPTNSIKSLKAQTLKAHLILWCYTNMFIIVFVIYYEIKMSRDALRAVEELVMELEFYFSCDFAPAV